MGDPNFGDRGCSRFKVGETADNGRMCCLRRWQARWVIDIQTEKLSVSMPGGVQIGFPGKC